MSLDKGRAIDRRGDGHDVAIVGAGAVGAALALALAQDGFGVALVERKAPAPVIPAEAGNDPAAETDLRVFALSPASRNLLTRIGAWPAIAAARVSPYRAMRVWDATGSTEIVFDAGMVGEDALGWIVEGRLLQHALWEAVRASPRVELVCPAEVAGAIEVRNRVELTLDGGRRIAARVAVAADGAESPLRTLAGIALEGRDYRQRAVVAHLACARDHERTAWQRFMPGGPIALLPLADGRVSIVWSLPDAEAARVLALDDAAFAAEATQASDGRLGALTTTTPRASFPLRRQLADVYARGRVALAGDAAHVVHPLAGQGMNLGLLDAAALTDTLSTARAAGEDIGTTRVLARYARARQGENALAAHAFEALGSIYGADTPLWTRLRATGLAALSALAPLKRQLALHACGYGGEIPPLARRL